RKSPDFPKRLGIGTLASSATDQGNPNVKIAADARSGSRQTSGSGLESELWRVPLRTVIGSFVISHSLVIAGSLVIGHFQMYPLFLNMNGRLAVVVGGGDTGRRKARALFDAGARVRLVCLEPCPADGTT